LVQEGFQKKEDVPQKGKDVAVQKKGEMTPQKRKRTTGLATRRPLDLMREFDRVFDSFRSDFEDLLWPSEHLIERMFPIVPTVEVRVPQVDLEDRGKDFRLVAEMPGFKKEDVSIQVADDAVEIEGLVGWKYDDKTKEYICKERECESFYRMITLPEEVKTDNIEANLKDGVLEVVLPKKTPKQKKKISVK
jgi:HSP20 family protein